MDVKELGHIVLYVKDLETSRGFYRDVLGWKEVASAGGQMACQLWPGLPRLPPPIRLVPSISRM